MARLKMRVELSVLLLSLLLPFHDTFLLPQPLALGANNETYAYEFSSSTTTISQNNELMVLDFFQELRPMFTIPSASSATSPATSSDASTTEAKDNVAVTVEEGVEETIEEVGQKDEEPTEAIQPQVESLSTCARPQLVAQSVLITEHTSVASPLPRTRFTFTSRLSEPYFLVTLTLLSDGVPCPNELIHVSSSMKIHVDDESDVESTNVESETSLQDPRTPIRHQKQLETNVHGKVTFKVSTFNNKPRQKGLWNRITRKSKSWLDRKLRKDKVFDEDVKQRMDITMALPEVEIRLPGMDENEALILNPDIAAFSALSTVTSQTLTSLAPSLPLPMAESVAYLVQTLMLNALGAVPVPMDVQSVAGRMVMQDNVAEEVVSKGFVKRDHQYVATFPSSSGNHTESSEDTNTRNRFKDEIETHLVVKNEQSQGYSRFLPKLKSDIKFSIHSLRKLRKNKRSVVSAARPVVVDESDKPVVAQDPSTSNIADAGNSSIIFDGSNTDTDTDMEELVHNVTTINNQAVALVENKGKLSQMVVKTVNDALLLVSKVLKSVGLSLKILVQKLSKTLHVDGIFRTHKFLHHYISIRRSHIRDSLTVMKDKFQSYMFGNHSVDGLNLPDLPLGKLIDGSVHNTGKQVTDMIEIPDARVAYIEDKLLNGLSNASFSEPERAQSLFKRLQELSDKVFNHSLSSLDRNGQFSDLETHSLLNGTDPLQTDPTKFFSTMNALYSRFKTAIDSTRSVALTALLEMNDLFFEIFNINMILPVALLLGSNTSTFTILELMTLYASPSVYYQYRLFTGRDPISQSDLDVLLNVTNPMLLRYTWNNDSPSQEVIHQRDTVLDWVPRAMLTTHSLTSIAWLHAEENAEKQMQDTGMVETSKKQKRDLIKWSRLFTSGPIAYMQGVLDYPVNDAQDASPESLETALTTPDMPGWTLWSAWTLPVLWKTVSPVRAAVSTSLQTYYSNVDAILDRAETIMTGVPMSLAIANVMYDLAPKTNWKSRPRATINGLSYAAWTLDGFSYFLNEKPLQKYTWKVLWTMCGLYQARLTAMMAFDVVGLTDVPETEGNETQDDPMLVRVSSRRMSDILDEAGVVFSNDNVTEDSGQVSETGTASMDPGFEEAKSAR